MIFWLLTQLERNPAAVFYERELRVRFGDKVDRAITEGVLRRLPLPEDGDTYARAGERYRLDGVGNGWEALATNDGEIEVTTLTATDILRCQPDVLALSARLRGVNGLAGSEVSPLGDSKRMIFVGEASQRGVREAFVLGLVSQPENARLVLTTVPAVLPAAIGATTVLCPTFVPDPTLERHLDSLSVEVARIDPDSLRVRRLKAEVSAKPSASFRFSVDFRSINYNGEEYPITGRQAQVVELLYRAWEAGTPSLGQDYLMEEIGSRGSRLRDLFRGSPLWRTLIVPSDAKGTVRLNI